MPKPHPDSAPLSVRCAVLTISDTRTTETDQSGILIQDKLTAAGHQIVTYRILPDEPDQIREQVAAWLLNPEIQACLLNGGTGIAPRDTTYEAIAGLLTTPIPGFGELFRSLSYQEVGSRALASRAIAGVSHHTLVFAMPGSSNAVRLALEALILPELSHLVKQMTP